MAHADNNTATGGAGGAGGAGGMGEGGRLTTGKPTSAWVLVRSAVSRTSTSSTGLYNSQLAGTSVAAHSGVNIGD